MIALIGRSLRQPVLVSPAPPRAGRSLPVAGAAAGFLRDPTGFLKRARAEHGDTFLLQAFGFQLLFVFSPAGVRALYQLPEGVASFEAATRTLIGFKLPDELLAGDMSMFHRLFGRSSTDAYLGHLRSAMQEELTELGPSGELEIFSRMKRLVHRLAFRCWAGREAASPRYFSRLVRLFEALDPEEAFVRPGRTLITVLTKKVPERRALAEVESVLDEIWRERRRAGRTEGDMLETLHETHASLPPDERKKRVARDVMILHLASQSNLYAALSWTLINLLVRPHLRDVVRAGDIETLDRCAYESIRVAQRSITLRKVVAEATLDDGNTVYHLQPGVFVATMLSVNNGAFASLDRFDPAHYDGGRLAKSVTLPTPEVVSTFGHGPHACPGRRFAIAAIRVAVTELFDALELEPLFTQPAPHPTQIGAVARADRPCIVAYRAKRAAESVGGAGI